MKSLSLLFTILLGTGIAHAQNSNISVVRNETAGLLGDISEKLLAAMKPEERAMLDGVTISVPIDANPLRIGTDGKRIELSTAFAIVSRQTVEAVLIERHFGRFAFGLIYPSYQARTYGDRQEGGDPAYKVANLNEVERAKLNEDSTIHAERMGLFAGLLAHVLAHEYGHIVLEHPVDELNFEKRRANEYAADLWAHNLMIKEGIPPITALYGMLYMYFLNEQNVDAERLSSHPIEAKRILKMADLSIESFDQFKWPPDMSVSDKQKFRDLLVKFRRQLEKDFNSAK